MKPSQSRTASKLESKCKPGLPDSRDFTLENKEKNKLYEQKCLWDFTGISVKPQIQSCKTHWL